MFLIFIMIIMEYFLAQIHFHLHNYYYFDFLKRILILIFSFLKILIFFKELKIVIPSYFLLNIYHPVNLFIIITTIIIIPFIIIFLNSNNFLHKFHNLLMSFFFNYSFTVSTEYPKMVKF